MTNNTPQIIVVFTLSSRAEENCSADKSQMKWSGYREKTCNNQAESLTLI